jgi:hypothetical protein
MQFPPTQQNLGRTRADFLVKEFRQLLAQKGLVVQWEQTIECPCNQQSSSSFGLDLANVTDINSESSGNNTDCPSCNGLGFIRHSSQEIQAIITNAEGEELVGTYGTLKKEDVKITLLPEHLVSYGDRITIKNSVLVWREINTVDALGEFTTQRPIITRDLELSTGNVNVGVLYAHKTDINGVALGEVPVDDITVDPVSGKITFTNPLTAPNPNTRLSVAYYANPTYSIISYPHSFRDTNVRKNQQEVPTAMLIQAMGRLDVD